MALAAELMALGTPNGVARRLGVVGISTGLVGAGTTQAGALQLTPGMSLFATVAAGSGAALPSAESGAPVYVFNGGANALSVYSLNGSSDVINANVSTAAFSVPAGKSCTFVPAGQQWIANVSS